MSIKHVDLGSRKAHIVFVQLQGVTAAQEPDELIAADRVIMIFDCASAPGVMLGCKLRSRAHVDDVIEMLARAGDHVFGKAE